MSQAEAGSGSSRATTISRPKVARRTGMRAGGQRGLRGGADQATAITGSLDMSSRAATSGEPDGVESRHVETILP